METTAPESPVIVHTSPVSSPVSSPVFVNSRNNDTINMESNNSKNIELEELLKTMTSLVNFLDLPTLDESLIKVQVENKPSEDPQPANAASDNVEGIKSTSTDTTAVDTKTTETAAEKSATQIVKDFKYCQDEFRKQLKEGNHIISPDAIMKLLRIAMTIVEQTKETGSNKKIFVVKLLTDIFINDTSSILGEHKLEALSLISGNVVSDAIDFIIDASKGKLNVNKIEEVAGNVAKSCFAQCWTRIFKRA
jgi:hypothetical protein